MKEGFYRLDFAGIQGVGMALIALDTGIIVGCDTEGGIFNGTYKWNNQKELLEAKVVFTSTVNGLMLVQGKTMNKGDTFNAQAAFPRDANGCTIAAQTDLGQVNIVITHIHDFPN